MQTVTKRRLNTYLKQNEESQSRHKNIIRGLVSWMFRNDGWNVLTNKGRINQRISLISILKCGNKHRNQKQKDTMLPLIQGFALSVSIYRSLLRSIVARFRAARERSTIDHNRGSANEPGGSSVILKYGLLERVFLWIA